MSWFCRRLVVILALVLGVQPLAFLGSPADGGATQAQPLYGITDLGTLGGDEGEAAAINASGQVVGWARVGTTNYRHAFLWTPTSPNATTGSFTDLGALLTDNESAATAINARGQVVGWWNNASGGVSAFLWTPTSPNGTSGSFTDLGTVFPGLGREHTRVNMATAINVHGQVVGGSQYRDESLAFHIHAFLWTPTSPNGTTGAITDLGTLIGPAGFSAAEGIDASGQVVGWSWVNFGGATHAFLWNPAVPNGTSGAFTDLGTLGGVSSAAYAINDAGRIVGSSQYNATTNFEDHAFLWTPTSPNATTGSMADLTPTFGDLGIARAINAAGQVVGMARIGQSEPRAYLWQGGTSTDLGTLSGLSRSQANGINSGGQVVGHSSAPTAGTTRAVLWTPASLSDSAAPDTSIASTVDGNSSAVSSGGVTRSTGMTITFTGTDNVAVAGFECKLDSAAFASCTSPHSLSSLASGSHTFEVRAKDAAGNVDQSPASFTWTVDTTPPDTSITTAVDGNGITVSAGGSTVSTSITIKFDGSDIVGVASFECSVDGATFAACTSPLALSNLGLGNHNFRVQAKDTAGNVDSSPASLTWSVVTPAQGTQNLVTTINAMSLPTGMTTSLTAPLDTAAKKLTDGNPGNDMAACDNLTEFKAKVADQLAAGKLTAQQAADLTKSADAIRAAQGCP